MGRIADNIRMIPPDFSFPRDTLDRLFPTDREVRLTLADGSTHHVTVLAVSTNPVALVVTAGASNEMIIPWHAIVTARPSARPPVGAVVGGA